MSCAFINSACSKSCAMTYNNVAQSTVAAGTVISLLGTAATDTGCSIIIGPSTFDIKSGGIYRITYDVTFQAGGAGVAQLNFLKNGTTLPCVNSQVNTVASQNYTLHGETLIQVSLCKMIPATFSAQLSGIAATINNVCATCQKVA